LTKCQSEVSEIVFSIDGRIVHVKLLHNISGALKFVT
jgi:hypothetical protein